MVANQEYSSFVCIFGAILNYVLCACASPLFDQVQPDDATLACEQVLLPSPTPLPLGTQRALSSLASSNTRSMGLPLPYFEIMRDGIAKKIRTQSLICDDCYQVGGIKSPGKFQGLRSRHAGRSSFISKAPFYWVHYPCLTGLKLSLASLKIICLSYSTVC